MALGECAVRRDQQAAQREREEDGGEALAVPASELVGAP